MSGKAVRETLAALGVIASFTSVAVRRIAVDNLGRAVGCESTREPSSLGASIMRKHRLTILLACCFAVGSCGGDISTGLSPDPTLTGSWLGSLSGKSVSVTLSEAADGSVTGDGSVTNDAGGRIALTVVGSHAFPRVALILLGFGSEAIVYRGTVAESSITGTLNGSGFTDEALLLERQ
jgi:hypothetical protein